MTPFTFENFEVTTACRAAHDACLEVAALRYAGDQPLVLLGPSQSGKSHLLWAIVQRVRAQAGNTDLVLVLAREFPDRVRALQRDPSPIRRGKPAIFLVDELERFDQHARDLEGVTRAFLDSGHTVVLATSVHPDRLTAFRRGFRALLRRGNVVETAPRGPDQDEQAAALARLQEETETLNAAVRQARQEAAAAHEEQARLLGELEESRRERAALQQRLAQAADHEDTVETLQRRAEAAAVEAEVARSEQARLEQELEALRKAPPPDTLQKERDELHQTVESLRGRLRLAQEEAAYAMAEQARVQARLSGLQHDVEESGIADSEAVERARADAARADELAGRAAMLCARVQAQQEAFAREDRTCAAGLDALLSVLARYEAAQRRQAVPQTAVAQDGQDELPGGLDADAGEEDPAFALVEAARREQGRLHGALEAARGRLGVLERELALLRLQREEQDGAMKTLRASAAGQAATATVQAGLLEGRIRELEEALTGAQGTADSAGDDLDGQLAGAVGHLNVLAQRLDALKLASQPLLAAQDPVQGALFDESPVPVAAADVRAAAERMLSKPAEAPHDNTAQG